MNNYKLKSKYAMIALFAFHALATYGNKSLDQLPVETQNQIFKYLSPEERGRVKTTCTSFVHHFEEGQFGLESTLCKEIHKLTERIPRDFTFYSLKNLEALLSKPEVQELNEEQQQQLLLNVSATSRKFFEKWYQTMQEQQSAHRATMFYNLPLNPFLIPEFFEEYRQQIQHLGYLNEQIKALERLLLNPNMTAEHKKSIEKQIESLKECRESEQKQDGRRINDYVFKRFYKEGNSIQEIADMFGISPGIVRNCINSNPSMYSPY